MNSRRLIATSLASLTCHPHTESQKRGKHRLRLLQGCNFVTDFKRDLGMKKIEKECVCLWVTLTQLHGFAASAALRGG
jgi:hypothetical protein